MKFFNCRVRLGGGVEHEVPKQNVSELEINLFRAIHGADAVVGIKRHCETNINQEDELRRLGEIYGDPVVEKMLGVKVTRFKPVVEDGDEDEEYVEEPVVGVHKSPEAVAASINATVASID
jgi:hypothetical protein